MENKAYNDKEFETFILHKFIDTYFSIDFIDATMDNC